MLMCHAVDVPLQGTTLLMCLSCMLKAMADRYSLVVVVINHTVSSWPGGAPAPNTSAPAQTSGSKPAMGEVWRGQAHVRLQLSNMAGTLKKATLLAFTFVSCMRTTLFSHM